VDIDYEVVVLEANLTPEGEGWEPFHGQTVTYIVSEGYYHNVQNYHKFKHFVYWRRIKL
jgi:hypothetical protein